MSQHDRPDHGDQPPPPPGSTPSSAPDTWGATTAPEYAGLPKRFLARVIDALIVGVPLGIILLAMLDLSPTGAAYGLIASIVNVAYFVLLESSQGGTFGKRMLGLAVASDAGGSVTAEQAFRRNWWLLLGLIPFVGGLASLAVTIYIAVTIASDERNRGWHDKLGSAAVLDR